MGTDVKKITEFIDNYLETHQMEYITPPEANGLLAEAGLLKDSISRPGKPLCLSGRKTMAYSKVRQPIGSWRSKRFTYM